MKIIVTENQLNYLLESINNISPCPEGKKEDALITLDQVKNGLTISKGYCNSNENSAIVKIQKMMQDKGLLDSKSYNGYYGDKTQEAVKLLWSPSEVEGTQIGNKTLEKLKGSENNDLNNKQESKTISSNEVSKNEALKLFNGLSKNEKILVCTLIGEAGGESNALKGMTAVANVLKNRADSNHLNKGKTLVDQALANKQFSMWNGYNSNNETLGEVYSKYNTHDQMQTAINIVKSIQSLEDITGGAQYYYATYASPGWAKNTDTTRWIKTTKIGNHIFGNVVKKKR
jgi:spore germination cell wall hydrolase CwlJ-like protein